MECSGSNKLMMKYMDNAITEKEAQQLHKHLSHCSECMDDFKIYDEILMDFSENEIVPTPIGFEDLVMQKIQECGVVYTKRANSIENIITFIFGSVSVVFGVLFMLAVNSQQVMNYLLASERFGSYAKAINPMASVVTEYVENFITTVSDFALNVGALLSEYRYVVLGAFVVTLIVQYILQRRDKVEV